MQDIVNSITPTYILSQHLIEWFSCPLRAFYLIHNKSTSLTIASRYRENIRLLNTFLYDLKNTNIVSNIEHNTTPAPVKTIQEVLISTKEAMKEQKSMKEAIFCMKKNILLFIPYMYWNTETKSWVIWYSMASNSHKRESMLQASLMLLYAREQDMPISQIVFFAHNKFKLIDKQLVTHEIISTNKYNFNDFYNTVKKELKQWKFFDVTNKIRNYVTQEKNTFKELFSLIEKEDAFINKDYWKGCNKQYCEFCFTEEQYEIDDIRTIRKSKHLTDDLYKEGIHKITDLPSGIPFEEVANRQIQSVSKNKTILYLQEIQDMLNMMEYPRYYLDFEAFNSSIPFLCKTKAWEYVPFLFSLQWQQRAQDKIYTQVWAMPPSIDKRKDMWDILKQHLNKAGSIIVYSSQFEDTILKQLSNFSNESSVYPQLRDKIVDLQEIFFNLSLYKPEQKGKISLKTIADVWLNISYSGFTVSEGIAANYYYVTFCDKAYNTFQNIKQSPYFSMLFDMLCNIEDSSIVLEDIMDYCKYDTKVMVSLVLLLEDTIDKLSKDNI